MQVVALLGTIRHLMMSYYHQMTAPTVHHAMMTMTLATTIAYRHGQCCQHRPSFENVMVMNAEMVKHDVTHVMVNYVADVHLE